jgi:hypothetical protein
MDYGNNETLWKPTIFKGNLASMSSEDLAELFWKKNSINIED